MSAGGPAPHEYRRFASWDGVEIAYLDLGGPSADPPVALYHGFAATADFNWLATRIAGDLVDAGRRVVMLDARGHGRSGKPVEPTAYAGNALANDLVALLEHAQVETFDLVGYSMGALVALGATSEGLVSPRRLVVGGVGHAVVDLGGFDREVIPLDVLHAAIATDDPATITHPAAAWFRANVDMLGGDRVALNAAVESFEPREYALERISAPTLVVAGARDPFANRPEVLAGAIPDARLEIFRGDHATVFGDRRLRATIAEFLGEG
jgi:pimeloyl-ACP methyl ester carboxylesterase